MVSASTRESSAVGLLESVQAAASNPSTAIPSLSRSGPSSSVGMVAIRLRLLAPGATVKLRPHFLHLRAGALHRRRDLPALAARGTCEVRHRLNLQGNGVASGYMLALNRAGCFRSVGTKPKQGLERTALGTRAYPNAPIWLLPKLFRKAMPRVWVESPPVVRSRRC